MDVPFFSVVYNLCLKREVFSTCVFVYNCLARAGAIQVVANLVQICHNLTKDLNEISKTSTFEGFLKDI